MEDTNPAPKVDSEKLDSLVAEAAEDAEQIKSRFARAIDDAKANAQDLRSNASEVAAAARDRASEVVATAREKVGETTSELTEQASALAKQAREKSLEVARAGKDKTSEAIAVVGRAIGDTAPVIDEKLGVQYGDYARNAAGALETSAEKLAAKDIGDLTNDVAEFVRKSPATALGIAAVTGFLLARLFSRSGDRDA